MSLRPRPSKLQARGEQADSDRVSRSPFRETDPNPRQRHSTATGFFPKLWSPEPRANVGVLWVKIDGFSW